MLTPQAIKDQEFQIKFRGCDPIEVRSFLEILAEDFFELHEAQRQQAKELEKIHHELEDVRDERDALQSDVKRTKGSAEDIQQKVEEGYRYKDERIAELTSELTRVVAEKATVTLDAQQLKDEMLVLENKVIEAQRAVATEQAEAEKQRAKSTFLEEQINELKQEGVDFKTTILVAQKFAEELKHKAQIEAENLVAAANQEVEAFKALADQELSALSAQIDTLVRTRNEVRDELRGKLEDVLYSLKVLDVADDDQDDLFDVNGTDLAPALADCDVSSEYSVDSSEDVIFAETEDVESLDDVRLSLDDVSL